MISIARATAQDRADIERLRREAYQAAPEFQVTDDRFLAWGRDDADGIVLAAWYEGQMVSTTRGNLLCNEAEAERFMECELSGIPLRYPALILSKGATSRDFGRHGLHSMLRHAFIRAARDSGIGSVTGIVFEGAPRTRLMHRVGYEYFSAKTVWYSHVQPSTRTLVAVLPRDSFGMALSALAGEVDVSRVQDTLCDEISELLASAQSRCR
jgi:hypothetical protein